MSGIYDEVEIEDMRYDDELQVYVYPCPCGDKFSITLVSEIARLKFSSSSSVLGIHGMNLINGLLRSFNICHSHMIS